MSFSRRVDRPNYASLNPFEQFLDRFTFIRETPFLKPRYSDAHGLTYGYKNTLQAQNVINLPGKVKLEVSGLYNSSPSNAENTGPSPTIKHFVSG